MALRIQNLLKKNFDEPHLTVSCPSWLNSNERQISLSLSKSISFKAYSPPQHYHELPLPDQESSSTLSIGQSCNEACAVGGSNSQDQCISSDSGQDESCGKGVEGKMKPVFLLSTPDSVSNHSQVDYSYPMVCTPYPYADPCFGGLFNPYGPHAIPQLGSNMVGMTAGRIPLPLDLADDGPIYVNAKQYHGILRRRQLRAKLEAQNKLAKNRKPYLHESRHVHALNRVRGSGGRFISTKKLHQGYPTSQYNVVDMHEKNDASELESCQSGAGQSGASNTTCSGITSASNSNSVFRQAAQSSGIAAAPRLGGGVQTNGGLMCSNGTQHHTPAVR